MSVTPDDVRRVAALARLRLAEPEVARFAAELTGILRHVDELRSLNLDGVEPSVIAAAAAAPARADLPGADPLHSAPADAAPAWHDGFFTVPRLAAQCGAAEQRGAEQPGAEQPGAEQRGAEQRGAAEQT
jgi:aspartyl-tRNA(Asn)/glutamyl-tRNA(Gln) amidotransferase subunit C